MGLTLSSPEFESYLALAEEFDIRVALHTGSGPLAPLTFVVLAFERRWAIPFSSRRHLYAMPNYTSTSYMAAIPF